MLPTDLSRIRPPGRPRALDDVKRREVIALISAGSSVEGAARYVGCAASTIRREALRNPQFNEDLRRASLTAELNPLQAIREASKKYWRAGAWLLERINPQRFGKQSVRHVKPEHVQEFIQIMGDIIKEEIRSPDAFRRIAERFQKLANEAERESWADRSPPPRARRRKSSREPVRFEYPPDHPSVIARQPSVDEPPPARPEN